MTRFSVFCAAIFAALLPTINAAQSQNVQPSVEHAPSGSFNEQNEPVFKVTGVEHVAFENEEAEGRFDGLIRVTTLVRTSAETVVEIRPLFPPTSLQDSILLDLVATAPLGTLETCEFIEHTTLFMYTTAQKVETIRVRGANNTITLPDTKQDSIAKAPPDCSNVLERPVEEVQEQFEATGTATRTLRPEEAFNLRDVNPNRATFVVDSENRVQAVIWQ